MSAPSLTLALDTSTSHGSVAVWDGARLLFEEECVTERGHSSLLFAVLERARAVGDFRLVAVGLGPGSYAGIRIAIAAGIGLSLAMGARLVGLPSTALLRPGRYVAIGDARRGAFYWTAVCDGCCEEGPELVDAATLRSRLAATPLPVFSSETLNDFPAERAWPSAVLLAQLASQNIGLTAEGALEPIYLREAHITPPKPR